MLKLIKLELKKFFKLKQIYLSIIGATMFSFLVFIYYMGEKDISMFSLPIASLGNLSQTFIIIIFLGFCAYSYGIDVQEKTLKILYTKTIPEWKVVLAKFVTGVIYTFVLLYIIAALVLLISSIFYNNIDFMEYNGDNIISAENGFRYVFLAYSFQGLALVFIVSLSITLAIIFDSAIISLILTFFLMIFSFLAGNIEFIGPVLPTTYWLVWQDIMKKDILWYHVWTSVAVLFLYSVILYFLSVFFYKRKDVKI